MLTAYIHAAMQRATYEWDDEDKRYIGTIPGLDGVWAYEQSLEACQEELQSALEDWILVGVYLHHPLPVVDGIDINVGVKQEA